MSVLDTLDGATAREESAKIITNARLRSEWEALLANLDEAAKEDARHGSLAGKPATTAAVDAMEAKRAEVEASEVEFFFAPMDWGAYIALRAAHPPVDGDPVHARRGFNVATFSDALIRACCSRVVGTDGDESTDIPTATWDHLLGAPAQPAVGDKEARPAVPPALDFGAVNKLVTAAMKANETDRTVPPSARSLLGSQSYAASSTPPSPGSSPRDASEDGSRPGSPTSTTTKPDTSSLASPGAT